VRNLIRVFVQDKFASEKSVDEGKGGRFEIFAGATGGENNSIVLEKINHSLVVVLLRISVLRFQSFVLERDFKNRLMN